MTSAAIYSDGIIFINGSDGDDMINVALADGAPG
jgi:hypothetical protein